VSLTIRTGLHSALPRLEAADIDSPRLDAELLLAHVLGTTRTSLFAYPERLLSPDEAERFEAALRRREVREPLPYITGTREFLGLPFRVTPAVLIPRPETEVLVETVAERLTAIHGREHPFRLLDIGTGSGCIAIGLAHLLPRATVVAVEPSPEALAVARANAVALGVADRLEWVEGAFPKAVADLADEFDAVVSNPPYIAEEEIAALQPEVRDWEPRGALAAGADGLTVIQALVEHAPRLLRRSPSSLLAMEVALGQAERVMELARADERYAAVQAMLDLAGIPRVCLAWTRVNEIDLVRDELRAEVELRAT
jgi:release factor glutamine methyltransferase